MLEIMEKVPIRSTRQPAPEAAVARFGEAQLELKLASGDELRHSIDIGAPDVDALVVKGIRHILRSGERIQARAGGALQCYYVNYFLTNPRNRVHTLRDQALQYFTRELAAYFRGSLKVNEGLAHASKFWSRLADENGEICSNYGYYCFHQRVADKTQYEWVIDCLSKNSDSRRAIININQPQHKSDTKDFPCTVSIQFYIRDASLSCDVFSRSTDIVTGLPYDIGFFSLVHELVYEHLRSSKYSSLKLGHTCMRTTFTQLYERSIAKALKAINAEHRSVLMPPVENAQGFLQDIYQSSNNTRLMKWITENAQ